MTTNPAVFGKAADSMCMVCAFVSMGGNKAFYFTPEKQEENAVLL